MPKRWRHRPHDAAAVAHLQAAAGVPAVVAQLLLCRGVCQGDDARTFLDPKLTALRDPELLPGMAAAVERITAAIAARERIVVYGDYDVDGVSATAIVWQCLKLLGADAGYYVPCRLEEGYGLNDEALASLAEQGARLIITVDCGIAAPAEAETARRLGLDLVVTDHHQFGARLPDAAALVHPGLPGGGYPFDGLSGAGVAFKLAWALCQRASGAQRVSPAMREFLLGAVSLAALGTVADVVPLLDENRVLVRHGLESLRARPSIGLERLLQVAELATKPRFSSEDIAFSLAPRLNAAGRLGQATLAVELLTTDSPQRAQALAEYINELNSSRQHLERSVYALASKQIQDEFDPDGDAALVLAGRGWHAGVIGIVAGRVVERFHRPAILISLDDLGVKPGVGSGRSVPGFDLHAALTACGDHLVSFGGHAAAAGLKIEEHRLEHFRADFCEHAATTIAPHEREAELWIDAEAPLSSFNLNTVDQIERLAPFGQANRRPVISATGVRLAEPPSRIGGGGRHLSLKLEQHGVRLRAVAFGHGDWADELAQIDGPLAVAFQPVVNDFRGQRRVELHLSDWRAVDVPATANSAAAH
ncbi:MAG: single-stranded-DNA-specific exonuclease RecJ [Pirellulales bacterium]